MLRLLNPSKLRAFKNCQQISTTAVTWQNKELVKMKEKDHSIRAVQKKPQRAPLVKNFFVRKVDTELLAYPEAIYENEHLNSVRQNKKVYEDFLATNIFANPDDVNNIRKLKEFGCFQSLSPLVTESLFGYSETEASVLSYSTYLNNHQQVLRLVKEFGDPSQQLKYLPMLENGDYTAVPCMFEVHGASTSTRPFLFEAKFKDASNQWILNGEKSFILMSPDHKDSTMFMVVASVESVDHVGDYNESIAVFLVDGSLPGVKISKVEETIGCTEKVFKQVTVLFEDVAVEKSTILNEKDGFAVAKSLLNSLRLDKGFQALGGVMKPLIKNLAHNAINTKIQGVHMKDIDTIKEQIGSLTCSYYALESMIYMTAGLIDIYEKQDVEMESAMVYAFAIQTMTDFVVRPLHAVGPQSVIKGEAFERFIRDATQVAAAGEYLDTVQQFISLSGFQHAGPILNEQVKMERNPLNHPAFIFSRVFKQTSIDHPKKKFNLDEYLHPSLVSAANLLESSILRLNAAAEILLARHGHEVVSHTVENAKIAEAATLCYAMFAVAARASRSYCIGLRNADQELHLANIFCFEKSEVVKRIAKEIDNGEYATSEHTFKIVGEKLIESKGYHIEHPTTRNF